VLATGNPGKLREFRALLGQAWDLVPQSELGVPTAEESGKSFRANALIKARHASAVTGLPAIADDSGLEVDVLDGAPGVHSARYAEESGATDEANNAKLLAAMGGIAALHRTARFRCVVAYVHSAQDPNPLLAEAAWEGLIGQVPQGANGFGYDPLFVDGASGLTSAQLPAAAKNDRSHRGRAVRELRRLLELSSNRSGRN
jgi:XTP/dITP diphosphohydrolase